MKAIYEQAYNEGKACAQGLKTGDKYHGAYGFARRAGYSEGTTGEACFVAGFLLHAPEQVNVNSDYEIHCSTWEG